MNEDDEFMVESWTKQELRELKDEMQSEGKVAPIFYDEGEIYD